MPEHTSRFTPSDILWAREFGQKEVLAAAREPTREMLEAAREWSRDKYGKPIGDDAALGCWQAMIDALLRSY